MNDQTGKLPFGRLDVILRHLDMLTDAQLLAEYESAVNLKSKADAAMGRITQEILRRARENEATAIVDDKYDCPIAETANYDRAAFTPFLELLSDNDLAKCYTPAHQETVDVDAKWDLVKLKPLVNKYGRSAIAIMTNATLEPTRRIGKFQRKEVQE